MECFRLINRIKNSLKIYNKSFTEKAKFFADFILEAKNVNKRLINHLAVKSIESHHIKPFVNVYMMYVLEAGKGDRESICAFFYTCKRILGIILPLYFFKKLTTGLPAVTNTYPDN